ncbi:cell division cycle protein 23 homolog [Cimex lectularius]|uniref:Cyclosome subunit 8 n=1 Tax=Cimex lectularius TaxID=79782 RepID=A0A8I6RPW6_CIMLE|nr:cell division cycle protein 23 homolog [Cimex lectularius]
METPLKIDLKEVKFNVQRALYDCTVRGLHHSAKWLAEICHCLKNVKSDIYIPKEPVVIPEEYDNYILAKSYFDLKEYDRCAFYSSNCNSPCIKFLHINSKYLSLERKKIDNLTELFCGPEPKLSSELQHLCTELRALYVKHKLDSYCMYLYGVVLKRLDLLDDARTVLAEAVNLEPLHWGAWMELAMLTTDRTKLRSLVLPTHWIKHFFLAHTFLEQQMNDEALEIYYEMQKSGFSESTYLLAQIAIAYHNKRDVAEAIDTFKRLRKLDPYRLDNMDVLSNLLYVREMKVELAYLAQEASEIDKYRVETCCVIGNYYSLRMEHQKAVVYFQRALKLNPQYLSAWTLMGHEYMEMKNTNAAIQSYRQAIEVNRRDYRAWYGLGQTYEILKMPYYSLYYYKQAQLLRPNDARMLIALGETYERLEKIQEALKCFYKARNVGDIDGSAILKLAKLYDKLGDSDQACSAFTEFVNENDQVLTADNKTELSQAYKYLANYHLNKNQLDLAYSFAQKCLNFEETKEEGQNLLKTISQKTGQDEEKEMQIT